MRSLRWERLGPAVVSPSAATISDASFVFRKPEVSSRHLPPLRGSVNETTADPTVSNAVSNQFNGMWPSYAGVLMKRERRAVLEDAGHALCAGVRRASALCSADDLHKVGTRCFTAQLFSSVMFLVGSLEGGKWGV